MSGRAGPGQKYDVDISGPQCDRVDWMQRLALKRRPNAGGDYVADSGQIAAHTTMHMGRQPILRTSNFVRFYRTNFDNNKIILVLF
jgi:hypothetical protein